MLWLDRKLLFIHIPKTGGSSIEEMYLTKKMDLGRRSLKMPQHGTIKQAQQLLGSEFDEYDLFTVSRNPWDRVISLYMIGYRYGDFGKFPDIPEFRQCKYVTFQDYYHVIDPARHRHAEDFFYYCAGESGVPENLHVIQFDNLVSGFREYVESIGVDITQDLGHINKNPVGDLSIREYFLSDPHFIDVIREKYKEEIEYFGYNPPTA